MSALFSVGGASKMTGDRPLYESILVAGCQSLDFASAVWFSLLTISHIFYLLVYQASLVWCTLCSKRHCVEAPNNTIFYLKAWLSSMKQVGWGAQSSLRLGWIRAGCSFGMLPLIFFLFLWYILSRLLTKSLVSHYLLSERQYMYHGENLIACLGFVAFPNYHTSASWLWKAFIIFLYPSSVPLCGLGHS